MGDGIEITKTETPQSDTEAFQAHFPSGEIDKATLSLLPQVVVKVFEGYNRRLIPESDYIPGNFNAVYRIKHKNDGTTYVAKQIKDYNINKKMISEESIYLVDTNDSGNIIGWGEIRKPLNGLDNSSNTPFVGFTNTVDDYKRQGLGRRRLILMNALSQMHYRLPLRSDSSLLPNSPAAKVWEKLVAEKKAVKYMGVEVPGYSFKS